MTDLRDLPPPLRLAVLRGEMTVEQAYNDLETPSPEDVERMLDDKPPRYSISFTAWPRKPQAMEASEAGVQRLAPEKAVACGLKPPAAQPDTQQIDQSERIAGLEQRLSELEAIVLALVDGGLR